MRSCAGSTRISKPDLLVVELELLLWRAKYSAAATAAAATTTSAAMIVQSFRRSDEAAAPLRGRFVSRFLGAWTGRLGGAGVRAFFATARARVAERPGTAPKFATCAFFPTA